MQIIRPLQLSFNHRELEYNRKFYFTASASLGLHLQTGESILEFDYLKDSLECMGEMPLPDIGMPKPCGEFIVSGNFYSKENKEVTEGRVKIELGQQEKELWIFGPRKWNNAMGPSKSEPFTMMPIDYKHAFGGDGFKKNPHGMGYKDDCLPCIEHPRHLVGSQVDTPDPAGFSPLDLMAPQRMQFCGTYDDNYLKDYFPGYPADFDWSYFLCTPHDQWLKGYYIGNEPYTIYNMHPEAPKIKGCLPDLYTRCFLRHTIKNSLVPDFDELPMKLDTLWLFPEKMLGLLIWRGVIEVADDEATQISHVLVAYENRKDEARNRDHYYRALKKRMNSDDCFLNHFNTEDLIPKGAKCAMELLQEKAFSKKKESEFSKNLDAKQKTTEKMVNEKLDEAIKHVEKKAAEAGGIPKEAQPDLKDMLKPNEDKPDPDVQKFKENLEKILPGVTSGDPKKLELKNFSFDKIGQMMAEVENLNKKKQDQAMGEIAKVKDQVNEQLKKEAKNMESMPEEAMKKLEEFKILEDIDPDKPSEGPLPRIDVEEVMAQLSQVSPQIMEGMQHLGKMKEMGIENETTKNFEKLVGKASEDQTKEIEEGLRKAKNDFKTLYIMSAHFMQDGLSPHKDSVEEVTAHFLKTVSDGSAVSQGDWACIDLNGQNLDGIDLSGAYLEQVNFKGASLKGANLSMAILARANMENADFSHADFEGANVGGVKASQAKFTGANFKSAKISKGDFTGADFGHCELEDVESIEIIVAAADFTEANMPKIKFLKTDLSKAIFNKSSIPTGIFIKCNISDADFSGANVSHCTFTDPQLENAVFNEADLTSSCFVTTKWESTLKNACFVKACLNRCNFQGMEMTGSDLSEAKMENAIFNEANLTNANLSNAQAHYAQFRKTKLTDAVLNRINLWEGSLAKAHLVNASFVGANLFATDFLRSTMGNTNFRDANLDQTLIQDWRPS